MFWTVFSSTYLKHYLFHLSLYIHSFNHVLITIMSCEKAYQCAIRKFHLHIELHLLNYHNSQPHAMALGKSTRPAKASSRLWCSV